MDDCIAAVMSGVLALLFIGLGLPLARGRVPPNTWYGYRLNRAVLADEDIWYAVNAAGGRHMIYAGCALALAFLLSLPWVGDPAAQDLLVLATLLISAIWVALSLRSTYGIARRMAREKGLR